MWGAQIKPDMVLRHFQMLADAVDLPLVVFEYPPASGIGYSPETLAALCNIPTVAAVKDWSSEIVAYEKNLRALRAAGRPVATSSTRRQARDGCHRRGQPGCTRCARGPRAALL
jgi:4-hydroxy-tetrahydrodipicolinate synthase